MDSNKRGKRSGVRGQGAPADLSSEDQLVVQPHLHIPYPAMRMDPRLVIVLHRGSQFHTSGMGMRLTQTLTRARVVGVVNVMVMV